MTLDSLSDKRGLVVRSGGQTGVDRAALDAAAARGFAVAGWCPAGRRAEDGAVPAEYPLVETDSDDYADRTRRNVLDADATLVLASGPLTGGSLLTLQIARQAGKPVLLVDPTAGDPGAVAKWISAHETRDLNVAGQRESEVPGIHATALDFVARVLAQYAEA